MERGEPIAGSLFGSLLRDVSERDDERDDGGHEEREKRGRESSGGGPGIGCGAGAPEAGIPVTIRTAGMPAALLFAGLLLHPCDGTAQWVEEPGRGWIDVTLYHQDTREAYGVDGEVRRMFTEGHAVSTSLFVTGAIGLFRGVDAWAQVPYSRLEFTDLAGRRLRTGIGDSRLYLRVRPTEYFDVSLPLAIRGGVKAPVGDFAVNSEVIPLGDGQTDWEIMAEVGHSFHPFPAYVNGWIGYRWREKNEETLQDFGDEVFFLAQAGGNAGDVLFQLVVEGFDGGTPRIEGFEVPTASRSLFQVTPTLGYEIGPGAAKAGARIPLAGENLPAGTAFVFGYFTSWSF